MQKGKSVLSTLTGSAQLAFKEITKKRSVVVQKKTPGPQGKEKREGSAGSQTMMNKDFFYLQMEEM